MLAPSSLNVYELFRVQRTYRAPLYQRAYVWNLTDHWEPLWEDIRSAADKAGAPQEERAAPHEHFLGAIVVQQDIVAAERISSSSIIDGQQRLTTLQVILCALRNLASSLEEASEAKSLQDLIENPGQELLGDRWKVWPTNIDRQQFAAVAGGRTRGTIGLRTGIIGAFRFFFKIFSDFCIVETNGSTVIERFSSLSRAVQLRLRIVLITLGPIDDPHMIFEALNARGTPLLASDLIKNHIFGTVRDTRMSPDAIYDKYWGYFTESPIDQRPHFWQHMIRIGRFHASWLDIYISIYLMMKLAREIPQSRLYAEFRGWWTPDLARRDIEARLTSLHEHAKIFVELMNADDSSAGKAAGNWVFNMGGLAAMPLLLSISSPEDGLTIEKERDELLRTIESYTVRRLVCGLPNTGHARFFLEILERAKREKPISSIWLKDTLASDSEPSRRWPDDTEFQRSWLEAPIYENVGSRTVKKILRALDRDMFSNKNERVSVDESKLEVEHVLPQKWREIDYPLPMTSHKEAARRFEEERKRKIHSFGNLTLLVSALNKDVSNDRFSVKRGKIAEQSALRLNVYFQRFTNDAPWDTQAIESRGRELFKQAVRLWPHPGNAARVGDVRDTLFLPRTSVLRVIQLIKQSRQHRITVNEIMRITGNHRVADLRHLGLISCEEVVVPAKMDSLSPEDCVILLAEQQETIVFAQAIVEHNPILRGVELGEHLASRYATHWSAASMNNYGGHLLTWVRWIARQKIARQVKAGELEVRRLIDNPAYWVTVDVVRSGGQQTLNELGWEAASRIWNDLTYSAKEAAEMIGMNTVSIRRQLKDRGIRSVRDESRVKLAEERAVTRKDRRQRPSWDQSISSEEKEELLRMWRDGNYKTKDIVIRSGFLAGSLYHRFGPRPKKPADQDSLGPVTGPSRS